MSAIDRNILTIIEPTIVLDEFSIPDVESGTSNSGGDSVRERPSKYSNLVPLIRINSYDVQINELEMFKLDCTGFYPTCRFSFTDERGAFTARHFPKDGDIFQLFIRSAGEETTFKPIRIDFTIEDIKPLGGGGSSDTPPQVLVEGRMNVPNLFTENVSFKEGDSWDSLLSIAEDLGLGFSSNVDFTNDSQIWINSYETYAKWIQDITANSYFDDESFFTSYIDPYYYINFVNINKLFGQEPDIENSHIHYQNESSLINTSGEIDEYAFPNMLSNAVELQGTSRYISNHQQINKSGQISKNNGYKRYTQYWDINEKEFISEFVDPISGGNPGLIPTTKGRIVNGKAEGPRNEQVKYKYLGVQGDNVHPNFMYSTILNYQNISELDKFGMIIDLDMINPSILRYSRIYCKIFEFEDSVKLALTRDSGEDAPDGIQQRDEDSFSDASDMAITNEYLSGFYVITGIEYLLTKPGLLRQRLHLRRREATPTT